MRLNIYTTIICLSFIVTISCEQRNDYAYEDWDTDNNALIDNDEFDARWNEISYYKAWDVDDDGILNEKEWAAGIEEKYENYDYDKQGAYEDWDRNSDGQLDEEEFRDGSNSAWDTDNDGNIDLVEYQTWYYGID